MPFYKIVDKKAQVGNKSHGADWIEYEVGAEPQELIDGLAFRSIEDIAGENLRALEATDKDMIRIAEDLLNLLVDKGLITESELPQYAQDKLSVRRNARANL